LPFFCLKLKFFVPGPVEVLTQQAHHVEHHRAGVALELHQTYLKTTPPSHFSFNLNKKHTPKPSNQKHIDHP